MTRHTPESFAEHVSFLALGVEPIDAGRGTRVSRAVAVAIEEGRWVPPRRPRRSADALDAAFDGRPRLDRHDSCRHALLRHAALRTPVVIRVGESQRRFVPRRLRVDLGQPNDDRANARSLRPVLFPGPAYDVSPGTTGVRGRVVRSGTDDPVRWARVTATLPGQVRVAAWTHGDERGEFLLLLAPEVGPQAEAPFPHPANVSVTVTIHTPKAPMAPSREDPLADLPIEQVPPANQADTVSSGEDVTTLYTPRTTTPIAIPLGRLISQTFSI